MIRNILFIVCFCVASVGLAHAVEPDEILKDPALETRARAISSELRCLVCQNQSIDDSHAPLARDLRLLVRDRLQAGDSDDAIRQFLVDRYGDFILLKPRFGTDTLILWASPFLVILLGGFVLWRQAQTRRAIRPVIEPLSAEEHARLKALLREDPPAG